MATPNSTELMQHLITGLQALQTDYVKLFEQHAGLEHKLANAREQYNELARLYGKTVVDTPPLSLASNSLSSNKEHTHPLSAVHVLRLRDQDQAATQLCIAHDASQQLLKDLLSDMSSKERVSQHYGKMPSITESTMEQDFTVPGTPSQLGCPFASMNGKKLSSHAASVLGRYHGSQQGGRARSQEAVSNRGSTSRATSLGQQKARRQSSLVDPVKAEICGLDTHSQPQVEMEDMPRAATEVGVCPIRFLNQHSPEELATYFEKHKHELPRSHEVCVRRYQSNEEQVRELDARYGDVAQMIRSLGEKHQSFLPEDPDDEAEETQNTADGDRVQQWTEGLSEPGVLSNDKHNAETVELIEERRPHFERPLREVRVGESPSRPWGIHVPAQYHERPLDDASPQPTQTEADQQAPGPSACPFAMMHANKPATNPFEAKEVPPALAQETASRSTTPKAAENKPLSSGNIFTGPIVVGYKPEEAALFLSKLGYLGS